jgi:spoIIIJ-associated protein
MEWIEVTGRTVEDAKELALDRLGVVEDELEFEVLDEPRSGFLGRIGRTEARIRARVKPLSREKPNDRRRRRSRPRNGRSDRAGGGGGQTTATRAARDERNDDDAEVTSSRPTGSGSANRSQRRRGRGGGGGANRTAGTSAATSRANEQREATDVEDVDLEEANVENQVPVEEQAATAAKFTVGLVDAFGVSARVQTDIRDDAVHVDIEGDGLGLLVGPHGATLNALEEIVRTVVQRAAGGHSARVHVDVGGYRQRRRDALAEFARVKAEQVKTEGVELALEPMGSADRKVVHDTIAEIDGVVTISQGEDPRRRVVIRPA